MELQARGYKVSKERVARLIQATGMKSIIHKKYKVRTTNRVGILATIYSGP